MGKNNLLVVVVVAAIVGGLGFYGGMQYQKSQGGFAGGRGSAGGPGQFQNGQARPSGAPNGMRQGGGQPVSGEITSIDDTTLTVKTRDGSSKIVIYSDSTSVNKTSSGSASDLKVGESVMVIGSQDTNGAVTAQTISVGGNTFQNPPGQ